MSEQTREEYVEWCKQRAREYFNRGELVNAAASMASDMDKREDTKTNAAITIFGAMAAARGDTEGVRRFIEGFR